MKVSALLLHIFLDIFVSSEAAPKNNLLRGLSSQKDNDVIKEGLRELKRKSTAKTNTKTKKSSKDENECLEFKYQVDFYDTFQGDVTMVGRYDTSTSSGLLLYSDDVNSRGSKIKIDEDDVLDCLDQTDTMAFYFQSCATPAAGHTSLNIFKKIKLELEGIGGIEYFPPSEDGRDDGVVLQEECCDFTWNSYDDKMMIECHQSFSDPTPQDCGIDISIHPNCPEFSCEWNLCEERPSRMQFLFQGGGCTNSKFLRCTEENPDYSSCERVEVSWLDTFTCVDSNGGPPTESGETVWIEVFNSKRPDVIYFQGSVEVGALFNAAEPENFVFAADVDVKIYEYDETAYAPGALLQEMRFHSSCSLQSSHALFLKDTFGSIQLVEIESDNGGLKSLFSSQTSEIEFGFKRNSEYSKLKLDSFDIEFESNVFPDTQSMTDLDVDYFQHYFDLSPNVEFAFEPSFATIPDEDHTAIVSIEGEVDGRKCSSTAQKTFHCSCSSTV